MSMSPSATPSPSVCTPSPGTGAINVMYNVAGMSQPTPVTCWATSFAVVINYRDHSSISPQDVCNTVNQDPNVAESWDTVTQAAQAYGLQQSASACMNIQGWADMLTSFGPLWICINYGHHAVVVNGVVGDGTEKGTTFYVTDPWAGPETMNLAGLNALFEALGANEPGDGLIIWHA